MAIWTSPLCVFLLTLCQTPCLAFQNKVKPEDGVGYLSEVLVSEPPGTSRCLKCLPDQRLVAKSEAVDLFNCLDLEILEVHVEEIVGGVDSHGGIGNDDMGLEEVEGNS